MQFENSRMTAFGLRFQPVDATHWLNRSAGVSKFNVFLGRAFSCLATALSLACECTDRSVPFGKYCLSRPLVFSFHYGVQRELHIHITEEVAVAGGPGVATNLRTDGGANSGHLIKCFSIKFGA